MQFLSLLLPLAAIGYLALVTARQVAALKGPLPLGGFTATEVCTAISVVCLALHFAIPRIIVAVRMRQAARLPARGKGELHEPLFWTYYHYVMWSMIPMGAILSAMGSAWLIEHHAICLIAATAAGLMPLVQLPTRYRAAAWLERRSRELEEIRRAN